MFGMGIGEMLIILVVALLVVGPDKLPQAAKSISKGLRDLRKQTREIQHSLEEDTQIGEAIRDLKSALRGDDPPPPPPRRPSQAAAQRLDQTGQSEPPPANATAPAQEQAASATDPATEPAPKIDPPAPSFPEPVIRTPGTAIARGSTGAEASDGPAEVTDTAQDIPPHDTPEQKAHG